MFSKYIYVYNNYIFSKTILLKINRYFCFQKISHIYTIYKVILFISHREIFNFINYLYCLYKLLKY